jgi:hypothetical protein
VGRRTYSASRASRARAAYSGKMVIEREWMVCRREKGNSIGGGAVGTRITDSRITEAAPLGSVEGANARCRKKGPVEESGNDRKPGRELHGGVIAGPVLEGWGVWTGSTRGEEEARVDTPGKGRIREKP